MVLFAMACSLLQLNPLNSLKLSAMEEEYNALIANKTWHLIPPSNNQNLIDCKWVDRIKRKADGSIDRYKARRVANRLQTMVWY
jgi:hypothetical protein